MGKRVAEQVALFGILLISFMSFFYSAASPKTISTSDFPAYYSAARLAAKGEINAIYNLDRIRAEEQSDFPALNGRWVPYLNPPTGLELLLPLALLPPDAARFVWIALTLAATAGGVAISCKLLRLDLFSSLWFAAYCLAAFGPAWEAARINKVTGLLLLVFLLAIAALNRRRVCVAGFISSLLFFKIDQLLLLAAFLFGAFQWRALLACGAGVMLMFAALYFWSGTAFAGLIHDYLRILSMRELTVFTDQPTLMVQLLRLGVQLQIAELVSNLIFVVGVLGLIGFGFYCRKSNKDLSIAALLVFPVILPLTLHAHNYDYIMALPIFAWLCKSRAMRRQPVAPGPEAAELFSKEAKPMPKHLKLATALVVIMYFLPIYLYVHYGIVLKTSLVNPYFIVQIICIPIAIYLYRSHTNENSTV